MIVTMNDASGMNLTNSKSQCCQSQGETTNCIQITTGTMFYQMLLRKQNASQMQCNAMPDNVCLMVVPTPTMIENSFSTSFE